MNIYSHRGESKYAPENTLSSFYLAYLLNSDGIECDIRKTKDDKLVIIHDKSINRTSNGKGNVSDYTLDELYNYDFGNKKYNDEKLLTLDEFLWNFSNKNIKIFLEVKEKNCEKLIWNTISKYNLDNITIISFYYEILDTFRSISNILKLGWLVYDVNKKNIENALNINVNILICLAANLSKKDVEFAKENSLKIGAWGVKNSAELKRLRKLKIDTLVYDSYYDAKRILKNE